MSQKGLLYNSKVFSLHSCGWIIFTFSNGPFVNSSVKFGNNKNIGLQLGISLI